MSGAPLNLILDVVILVLLGMTIVYAARLSLQLKRLRDSRGDMDKIVRELVRNIDKAERAVVMLRESADEQGAKLQRTIGNAVSLADELQLMTDSGDRLASRLEKLVDGVTPLTRDIQAKSDALSDLAESVQGRGEPAPQSNVPPIRAPQAQPPVRKAAPAEAARAPAAANQAGKQGGAEPQKAYSAHLRKVDAADVPLAKQDGPSFSIRDPEVERGINPFEQGVGDDPALYSEAERDLFRAIKGLYDR